MIEKKIKESFDHASLSEEDKERIYQKIIANKASSPQYERKTGNKKSTVISIERKSGMKKLAAACAVGIILCGGSVGVYSAYKWSAPSKVADQLEDHKLAKAFAKEESEIQIQETKDYRVANLGVVSGKDIGHEIIADGQIVNDRTYVAVAIERLDGTDMDVEKDDIFVSPLIQHLKPWQYNIYFMNGDGSKFVKDGILYMIYCCDNIEMFAANKVYLAVQSGNVYNTEAYNYDEKTGEVTRNESFKDLNLLFDLQLDASKADEKAANEFIDNWNKKNEEETSTQEANDEKVTYSKILTSVKDEKNNLTLNVWDGTHFNSVSADDDYAHSYFGLYPEVVGEGIDTITYQLGEGKFAKKQEATYDEADEKYSVENSEYLGIMSKEYVGATKLGDENKQCWLLKEADSSYTVAYDKQNTLDHLYAIGVNAKVTGETERIGYYKAVANELSKQTVNVTIKFKDGHTVEKKITFTYNDVEFASHMITTNWENN